MVEEQAASTFFNVGSRGYMMLPGLMAPSEVDSLAQQVDQYIASGGRMLRPYGLGNRGGWYVADFQLALPRVYAALHGRRRLHAALSDIFGGPRYRVLARNDLYTDLHTDWHLDKLSGPFTKYLGPDRCAMWKRKADGDDAGYRILTVGLYLEDHSADTDDRALTVAPYSQHNACYRRPYANYTTARAHPRKGDAVVFDTRISHRGQAKAYANFERNVAQPHRTLLTLNYGLHGEFSDGYDRGFAMRNLVLNNVSACGGKLDVRCAKKLVAADISVNPVPLVLSKLVGP